ncbi:MAG: DNA polymerase III subunit delta [Lachnospiraceae bacterium]|nr:DNA polymerase III subunit delta [Lachnospiraceae bacterium]
MKTLMEDLRARRLRHVYLLYGDEAYLVRQYKNKLKEALAADGDSMNAAFFDGKDIDPRQLIDLAETMPFFAEHRSIFVDGSGFFKKSPEDLAAYMAEIPETTYFVFSETEVDRRSRLYKQVKKLGHAAEFKRQTDSSLMKWIGRKLEQEGKKAARPAMELFLAKTGSDMETIDRELEKLLCYTMDRDAITEQDVEAVCVESVSGRIFEMVDAIAGRNQQRALELYYDLLTLKEPPMRILFLMMRQFQTLMHLKELAAQGFDRKSMASKAGVPEFAVRKYIGQSQKFGIGQLRQAVRDGVQADEDVKTGKVSDQLAVELFLITYSRDGE